MASIPRGSLSEEERDIIIRRLTDAFLYYPQFDGPNPEDWGTNGDDDIGEPTGGVAHSQLMAEWAKICKDFEHAHYSLAVLHTQLPDIWYLSMEVLAASRRQFSNGSRAIARDFFKSQVRANLPYAKSVPSREQSLEAAFAAHLMELEARYEGLRKSVELEKLAIAAQPPPGHFKNLERHVAEASEHLEAGLRSALTSFAGFRTLELKRELEAVWSQQPRSGTSCACGDPSHWVTPPPLVRPGAAPAPSPGKAAAGSGSASEA